MGTVRFYSELRKIKNGQSRVLKYKQLYIKVFVCHVISTNRKFINAEDTGVKKNMKRKMLTNIRTTFELTSKL